MERFESMVQVENYVWNIMLFRHVSSKGIDRKSFKKEALDFLWTSDRIPQNFRDSKIFHFLDFFLRWKFENFTFPESEIKVNGSDNN